MSETEEKILKELQEKMKELKSHNDIEITKKIDSIIEENKL